MHAYTKSLHTPLHAREQTVKMSSVYFQSLVCKRTKVQASQITHVNGVHNVDPAELCIFHPGDLSQFLFVTVFLDVYKIGATNEADNEGIPSVPLNIHMSKTFPFDTKLFLQTSFTEAKHKQDEINCFGPHNTVTSILSF